MLNDDFGISKGIFYLCLIGSVDFDDHLINLLLATTLFASAIFGGGCSAGAYRHIAGKNAKIPSYFKFCTGW